MDAYWFGWALGISEMIKLFDLIKFYPHLNMDKIAAELFAAVMHTSDFDVHYPSYLAGLYRGYELKEGKDEV